jgi:2-methylcitrate dehydratase
LEHKQTLVNDLADFVAKARFTDLSDAAKDALKIRVLDALGCAIGAIEGEPIRMLRAQLEDFGGKPHCTLIGGGKTAPDLAAF